MSLDELMQETLENNDKFFPGWEDFKIDATSDWTVEDIEYLGKEMMHLYWTNAIAGEAGELANGSKKYLRYVLGWAGKKLTWEEYQAMAELELGDIFIYLVLYSRILGIDLRESIRKTLEKNYRRFEIAGEVSRLG